MFRVLGLINARAGSKSIKNKNIKNLHGLPLIAWTIKSSLKSKLISDLVVSSDSKRILSISKKYKVKYNFLRPDYLSKDNSKQFDVVYYMVNKLSKLGMNYDAIILLQPTFPLRSSKDIDDSIKIMKKTNADSVISVTETNPNLPYTLYTKDYSNNLKSLFKIPKKGTNRQNLRKIYSRVGCIYLTKTKTILKNKSIYGKRIKSILIPDYRSFDIDTIHDWDLLESWIKTKKNKYKFYENW